MMHRHCFEVLDRKLRDILRHQNNDRLDIPFGGKVVVLRGDFLQVLPVIPKGTRQDIVCASINSSFLWNYCEVLTLTTIMRLLHECLSNDFQERKDCGEWVLGIDDGSIGEDNDEDIKVKIPDDLHIHSSGDHIASIVDCIYPSLIMNMHDTSFFQDKGILTPKNVIVEEINDYMLFVIPREEMTYLSCDYPLANPSMVNRPDDVHTPKFLNTINMHLVYLITKLN